MFALKDKPCRNNELLRLNPKYRQIALQQPPQPETDLANNQNKVPLVWKFGMKPVVSQQSPSLRS